MGIYFVRARRWSGGWELHIAGEGVTQCQTLFEARQQVVDYLTTAHGEANFDDAEVRVLAAFNGYSVWIIAK